MRLSEYLWNQIRNQRIISLTGSGGKTTLMCLLAEKMQREGHSVLLSTTTKLASPLHYPYPVQKVFLDDGVFSYRPRTGEGVFYARDYGNGKVCSPELSAFPLLLPFYDYLLIEADGSRRLPLKYHTARDPVVPSGSFPIAVMGLSSLGKSIASACFGHTQEGVVDEAFLQWLIDQPEGALKGKARLLVLNQAETVKLPLSLHAPVPMLYASGSSDVLLMQV